MFKQCHITERDVLDLRAFVLAGGDGTRLQSLTHQIDGDGRPKQFSKIFGGKSLLTHTRERLRPIFAEDQVAFIFGASSNRGVMVLNYRKTSCSGAPIFGVKVEVIYGRERTFSGNSRRQSRRAESCLRFLQHQRLRTQSTRLVLQRRLRSGRKSHPHRGFRESGRGFESARRGRHRCAGHDGYGSTRGVAVDRRVCA